MLWQDYCISAQERKVRGGLLACSYDNVAFGYESGHHHYPRKINELIDVTPDAAASSVPFCVAGNI